MSKEIFVALFAPVRELGLIVVDEEHEGSYKQEKTPRYHARDVAVRLAQLVSGTCLLGSATPALESAYRAERGEYVLLRMPQRIMGHRRVVDEQAAQVARAHAGRCALCRTAAGGSGGHARRAAPVEEQDGLLAQGQGLLQGLVQRKGKDALVAFAQLGAHVHYFHGRQFGVQRVVQG